jgi:hypothetical protein
MHFRNGNVFISVNILVDNSLWLCPAYSYGQQKKEKEF